MKVWELIAELQRYLPDTNVVISGYEGGYNYVKEVRPLKIAVDALKDSPYQGRHESYDEVQKDIKATVYIS